MDFKLPKLAEGVDSADVADVMVAEGDTITAGQIVMQLETDKAVMELPCPHAGKITKLNVKTGDTVKTGQVLFAIETVGAPATSNGAKTAEAPAKPQPAAAPAAKVGPVQSTTKPEPSAMK